MTGKIPSGKVPFLWQLSEIKNRYNLTMSAFADLMKADGIQGILIKLVEGRILFNQGPLLDEFFKEMQRVGIEVHAWSYNYGDTNPERKSFGQAIREYELSSQMIKTYPQILSWTVNAEKEFKGSDGSPTPFVQEAKELMELYNSLPVPVGFTSYKFPSQHNLAWGEFIGAADFLIPQVYWQGATAVDAGVKQLDQSITEWLAFAPGEQKAVIPAGTMYKESNYPTQGQTWWPTVEQIELFVDRCIFQNEKVPHVFTGVSMWELVSPYPRPELWEAFVLKPWPVQVPGPGNPPDPEPLPADLAAIEARLSALEDAFRYLVVGLSDVVLSIPTATPDPGPQPVPLPNPVPTPVPVPNPGEVPQTMVKLSSEFTRISLSFQVGLNNGKPPRPIMEFFPSDVSKVAERISLKPGSMVAVEKDAYIMDGMAPYWKVIKDQDFNYANGSQKVFVAGEHDLYINNKFLA